MTWFAGLTLGSITGTLESLPGLLVLVPAAIGMRGNVFGALGSRLGTAVHTGTFRMSGRRDTLVGQNLAAAMSMSLSVSLVLAILAKAICVAFGLENTISVADFVVISVIGGILSSVVVMGITVVVAQLGVRRNWDLDNVTAPIVTAAGDMVTLPTLFVATYLVGIPWLTVIVAILCGAVALVALVCQHPLEVPDPAAHRARVAARPRPRRDHRRDRRASPSRSASSRSSCTRRCWCSCRRSSRTPARSGASSSARVSTKLHLGTLVPGRGSLRSIGEDFLLVVHVHDPGVLPARGVGRHRRVVAGLKSPGSLEMIAVR